MHEHIKAGIHAVVAIVGAVAAFWPAVIVAIQIGAAIVAIYSGICAARYYNKARKKIT